MTDPDKKAEILIVDDEPLNLILLGEMLSHDYEIRVAASGSTAVEIAMSEHPPDLILLDIVMPGMNGHEVCRRIKSEPAARDIPVIFITTRSDTEDEAMGFSLGAVDYITKPFRPAVIGARIRTHLDLKSHRDHLERLVAERTRELIEKSAELRNSVDTIQQARDQLILAEKMAALGSMVAGATHEINTPLGIGLTVTSHLQELTQKLHREFLNGALKRADVDKFCKTVFESLHMLQLNLGNASRLIRSFKTVAVDQCSDEPRAFDLKEYLEEILVSLSPRMRTPPHAIRVECPEKMVLTSFPGALCQIITNLVTNSLVHGFETTQGNEIRIQAAPANGNVRIHYQDNGRGIPREHLDKIFQPFFTTRRGKGGSGLGLHVVHELVVRKLKGELRCESIPGRGVHFYVEFPSRSS
ncbi:MAG: hybrid sensor histidine kinase/response regulator [Thermodesulfobacteriota bacterium]